MPNTVSFSNKLSRKLLIYILLFSSVLSVASTAIQLYVDFKDSLHMLEQRFDNINNGYVHSIATSLWDFNEDSTKQQLDGIVKLPDIRYAKITTGFEQTYHSGELFENPAQVVMVDLVFEENKIGELTMYAHYDDIYQNLRQKAGFILVGEIIKIFIAALFIAFIVHWLISRHIYHITDYSKNISADNLDMPLELQSRKGRRDELDVLVDAINAMRLTLKHDIYKLEKAENALINLNGDLEIKVYDRTAKLAESNKQLQHSLDDLTLAKDQLVQSEKMASLGQLVAGVAHEVNTPLGICVTSITALREKIVELNRSIESGKLTKSNLTKTLDLLLEYQEIIERSLNKAVDLIRGFKSVAVEQHTDPELNINLAQHVTDVVTTVKTLFKQKDYTINVEIDPDLNLVTFPSAWNQILTNFLMNSHLHGFDGLQEGDISIVFKEDSNWLTLDYKDNGKGLDSNIKSRIFDPFVTTKRGQGGSGLGMNIVFNLVNAKLNGSIQCIDIEQGCQFRVRVPISK